MLISSVLGLNLNHIRKIRNNKKAMMLCVFIAVSLIVTGYSQGFVLSNEWASPEMKEPLRERRQAAFVWQCDFDNDSDPLCGMTQSTNDSFDWTRQSGDTPSDPTGPSSAHSGTHYIFIEATNKSTGDFAVMDLPQMPPGRYCLAFYFHMYGFHINELSVILDSQGQEEQKWMMSGQQADVWMQGKVILKVNDGNQVSFKATRGEEYSGDIALDDITVSSDLTQCLQNNAQVVSSIVSSVSTNVTAGYASLENGTFLWYCDFDSTSNPLCGMTQSTNDSFDWTRHSGDTPSDPTGPSSAHSGTHYIFIEASNKSSGDFAVMNLPPVPTGRYCLSFYFHMFGFHIMDLSVILDTKGQEEQIWLMSGKQGEVWWNGKVAFNVQRCTLIAFKATRGDGYSGDIAIDDVLLTSDLTQCPQTNFVWQCDFDSASDPLCGMTQSANDTFDWTRQSGETPSDNTGPEAAHSGTHYIFIEATERNNGDFAVMNLPILPAGRYCLSFYFYMFGDQISELSVMLDTQGQTEQVWMISGEQGELWTKGHVAVTVQEDTKISFKAIRGEDNAGDIALDDVTVSGDLTQCSQSGAQYATGVSSLSTTEATTVANGTSPSTTLQSQPTTATSAVSTNEANSTSSSPSTTESTASPNVTNGIPFVWQCDFDNSSEPLCSMTQSASDTFNWTRQSGKTNSDDTGPTSAHSGTHYIFIEATNTNTGDFAVINLPTMPADRYCLSFYFHMYGHHTGNLSVILDSQGQEEQIWMMSGNQGDLWMNGTVEFDVQQGTQIGFKAVRGTGYSSDISLDDITLTSDLTQCAQNNTSSASETPAVAGAK